LGNCFPHQLVKKANYISSVMVIVKHSGLFVSGSSLSNSSQTLSGLKKERIGERLRRGEKEMSSLEG